MNTREHTKQVLVGDVPVGGGAPVVVQSMTKTDTRNAAATLEQISRLERARCRIVRVAVPDDVAAKAFGEIVRKSPLPVIADIHFDHKLALQATRSGAAGLRINPGTIGSRQKVAEVADACKERNVPIRVGVNAGSLPKALLKKHGGPTAAAMVEAALDQVRLLGDLNFFHVKVSLKASDVERTIQACAGFAEKSDLPQHIGVTEAGSVLSGSVKSAVALSRVLSAGIGDTIRVSLAGDPVTEVRAAYAILRAVGLNKAGVEVVACPTCGRLEADTLAVVAQLEDACGHMETSATVAVMGCPVNGPGECREADLGIVVAGTDEFRLYRKGNYAGRIARADVIRTVLDELKTIRD